MSSSTYITFAKGVSIFKSSLLIAFEHPQGFSRIDIDSQNMKNSCLFRF